MLRLTMLLASAFLIRQAGAMPRQEGAEGGKKRDRVEGWGELEKEKDREDRVKGDEKDLEGDAQTPSQKDKPEKEKEEDKSNRESVNPTADKCTRSLDGRFDVCRNTMWQGCVGVEDGRLHPQCDDVPGYDYGCQTSEHHVDLSRRTFTIGYCWSTCVSRDGNPRTHARCWLGSNYRQWVDELGTSMLGPRESRSPEYVPCREKRDCAKRSPWLLQCFGHCTASPDQLAQMYFQIIREKIAKELFPAGEGGSMKAS